MEPPKTLAIEDVSNFLRQTQFLVSNLFMLFYPIRSDRHVFIQVVNTITGLCMHESGGAAYTWTNLPWRSTLAALSLVANLKMEANSRRAFAAEHGAKQQKANAAARQIRTKVSQGNDVLHASASFSRGRKNDWFEWGTDGEYNAGAKTKVG